MATEKQNAALTDVHNQIAEVINEAFQTHGFTVTMGGIVSALGTMLGTIDRDHPGAGALAAFHRTFSVVYDAAFFRPQVGTMPAGEA